MAPQVSISLPTIHSDVAPVVIVSTSRDSQFGLNIEKQQVPFSEKKPKRESFFQLPELDSIDEIQKKPLKQSPTHKKHIPVSHLSKEHVIDAPIARKKVTKKLINELKKVYAAPASNVVYNPNAKPNEPPKKKKKAARVHVAKDSVIPKSIKKEKLAKRRKSKIKIKSTNSSASSSLHSLQPQASELETIAPLPTMSERRHSVTVSTDYAYTQSSDTRIHTSRSLDLLRSVESLPIESPISKSAPPTVPSSITSLESIDRSAYNKKGFKRASNAPSPIQPKYNLEKPTKSDKERQVSDFLSKMTDQANLLTGDTKERYQKLSAPIFDGQEYLSGQDALTKIKIMFDSMGMNLRYKDLQYLKQIFEVVGGTQLNQKQFMVIAALAERLSAAT